MNGFSMVVCKNLNCIKSFDLEGLAISQMLKQMADEVSHISKAENLHDNEWCKNIY